MTKWLALAVIVLARQAPPSVSWDQVLRQSDGWYAAADAARIADNVLLYQRATGGWPKNIDMATPLSAADRARVVADRAVTDSTIDNGATVTQLRFLARVNAGAPREPLHASLLAGIDYLLKAQYANGGWPQYFPLRAGYWSHITFNDDAMVGVMTLLQDVASARAPFDFVDRVRAARASDAVARGRALIVQLQIRAGGRLTGWGQQYDEHTLQPAGARTYEHPSIASRETVGILRYLMTIDQPRADVVAAVDAAVAWLRASELHGLRVQRTADDVVVVDDPSAPPIWARFYDIATNRPIYSGRDGVIKDRLSEIERERRTGYSWLGPYATAVLADEYPKWKQAHRG